MSSDIRATPVGPAVEADGPRAAGEGEVSAKGLATGRVGLLAAVTMGVGSAGPAYSLAASLGIMALVVGLKAPAMLIISFIPMLMVSTAFYSFARVDPDCGQAFSWTTRALGPHMGWILGFWGLAMVLVIGPNIANVVATYFYLLIGFESAAASSFWLTLGSVVLLLIVGALVAAGVELSVRMQYVLMGLEVGSLIVFAAVTLIKPYVSAPAGHVGLSLGMFLPTNMSWSAIADGMLIGVFFYTGWDVATSLGEESKGSRRLPGAAAVLSTVVLVLIFTLSAAGAQSYHGSQFLVDNTGDVLSAVAGDALGNPWYKIVQLAVFTGTAAATLGMTVYISRWALSMASHRAFPSIFGRVNPRYRTPFWGVVILIGVAIVIRIAITFLSQNVVYDLVPSIALLSTIEYAFAGFACIVYFRKWLTKSFGNFLLMGVLPALGGAILLFVYIRSAINYWDPAYSYSGGWLGVGTAFWIGVGGTVLGGVLVFVAWAFKPKFFTRKPETWPGEGQPIPYQDETVV